MLSCCEKTYSCYSLDRALNDFCLKGNAWRFKSAIFGMEVMQKYWRKCQIALTFALSELIFWSLWNENEKMQSICVYFWKNYIKTKIANAEYRWQSIGTLEISLNNLTKKLWYRRRGFRLEPCPLKLFCIYFEQVAVWILYLLIFFHSFPLFRATVVVFWF